MTYRDRRRQRVLDMNGCFTDHGRKRPLLQAIYFYYDSTSLAHAGRHLFGQLLQAYGIGWKDMEMFAFLGSLFSSLSKDSGRMYNQSINGCMGSLCLPFWTDIFVYQHACFFGWSLLRWAFVYLSVACDWCLSVAQVSEVWAYHACLGIDSIACFWEQMLGTLPWQFGTTLITIG